jgi:hypothetical protein
MRLNGRFEIEALSQIGIIVTEGKYSTMMALKYA